MRMALAVATALLLSTGCTSASGTTDARQEAKSPAATGARSAGSKETSATADAFRHRASGLIPARQLQRDVCEAGEESSFNHGRDTYRFRCTRTLIMYFGADGAIVDRIREMDAAIKDVVRKRTGSKPITDQSFETVDEAMKYYASDGKDGPVPTLTYRWSVGGGAQNKFKARMDWEDPVKDRGRFFLQGPGNYVCSTSNGGVNASRSAVQECQTVDQEAETSRIRARHRYAVKVTLEDNYYELEWE
ncbi:hypothetical protein [Streptomyces netropsis]|uniref:Lipoprotein n=1 Tax=Streptomyces netropsis TaxID=55404 RepID=A0A7W7PFL5_STRNE|nr:hypothetical protein [Streptomyces netropsis]MBB4887882.1 hypothetical protein [Streptomyces netropsis]GGR52201.1 hypothetical protein GCM10010219_66570 [Streptomyces netropsis]